MNELKCSKEGCLETFKTNEALFSNATYLCRNHTTKSTQKVHFQEHQFDRGIARGTEYIGNPFDESNQDKVRHKKLKAE